MHTWDRHIAELSDEYLKGVASNWDLYNIMKQEINNFVKK